MRRQEYRGDGLLQRLRDVFPSVKAAVDLFASRAQQHSLLGYKRFSKTSKLSEKNTGIFLCRVKKIYLLNAIDLV